MILFLLALDLMTNRSYPIRSVSLKLKKKKKPLTALLILIVVYNLGGKHSLVSVVDMVHNIQIRKLIRSVAESEQREPLRTEWSGIPD